jgi:hypothetical protein
VLSYVASDPISSHYIVTFDLCSAIPFNLHAHTPIGIKFVPSIAVAEKDLLALLEEQ